MSGKRRLIIAVLLAVFLLSVYQLSEIFYKYQSAEKSYGKIRKNCVTEITKKNLPTENKEKEYPALEIDFEKLQEINHETVGWLYLESCRISYPIVQGKDNQYYLTHTVTGEENSSGSIFLDYRNKADFQDSHTVIYGHNMKNGAMFGRLKKLYQEEELCGKNPYFYIYLPAGEVLQYRIFSYDITSDTVIYCENSGSKEGCREPVVSLATCFGTDGLNRLFIHGILVKK